MWSKICKILARGVADVNYILLNEKNIFAGYKYFLSDHWYYCFGLLVMSSLGSKALFILGSSIHVTHSLRFTFGATPDDLLVASIATELISSTYLWPGISGTRNQDLLCHRWTLYQLSYAGSASHIFGWPDFSTISYHDAKVSVWVSVTGGVQRNFYSRADQSAKHFTGP